MKRITMDYLRSLRPCETWTGERMQDRAQDRESMTALEFSQLTDIPAADRLWVLLRTDFVSEANLRRFGCDCAERKLQREVRSGREPHESSWAAIETARRHADGCATDEELTAAAIAARAVATDNVATAAWAAAEAATGLAARAASAAAARTAIEGTDVQTTEFEWQIQQLRKYL